MKRFLALLATCVCVGPSTNISAQDSPAPAEKRQDVRDARQDARQDNRQETRDDRRDARQQRAQQRLDNRSTYYTDQTWRQLDPWITRNNVTPLERLNRAADAVVNATEKALNTAGNVAEKVNDSATAALGSATDGALGDARYGYTNPNGPGKTGWFYDYYSYSPTYYNAPATGSKIYGSATRYYDLNNDGVYDSLNVFRDSDNNASYDVYDRYDFGDFDDKLDEKVDKPKPTAAEQLADSPEDANRHTFVGKIYASKTAKVNGVENLVVRLSNADAKDPSTNVNEGSMFVDLGPKQTWKDTSFKVGDTLSATGPLERIGDKSILMAESASVNEQKETQIARTAPRMEGLVMDVTQTEVKGTQHTLAIVESESKRQLVDLGPTDKLKIKVEPQTKITVQGIPVRVRDHSVVQAERASIDGKEIIIQRW